MLITQVLGLRYMILLNCLSLVSMNFLVARGCPGRSDFDLCHECSAGRVGLLVRHLPIAFDSLRRGSGFIFQSFEFLVVTSGAQLPTQVVQPACLPDRAADLPRPWL